METLTLNVQTRDMKVKTNALRIKNLIPAEYYGKGVKNKSFAVDYQTFRKTYKQAGSNTVITLDDGKDKYNVLVHEIQYDPVSDSIIHIDFANVKMDQEVKTKVKVVVIGTAPAVKDLGGILVTPLDEVEIKCLPKDLIHKIEVSIEPLVDFNSFIRVKNLIVPPGITILDAPEDIIATAVPPREEKEEETTTPLASEVPVAGKEGEVAEGAEAEGEEGAKPAKPVVEKEKGKEKGKE